MCSDVDAIRFLERRPESTPSAREPASSKENSAVEIDAANRRLEQALIRKMPSIRRQIEGVGQSDWSLHEYLERLYNRLRDRLDVIDDLDDAIDAGIRSLLHEDARNRERRSTRVQPLDHKLADATPHPSSLEFLTTLLNRDKLKQFIKLLDPWTRAAFYAIHIDGEDLPHAAIAHRFGMRANAFNKRFRRGMDRAREKYVAIYGPG